MKTPPHARHAPIEISGKYWDILTPAQGAAMDFGWRSNVIVTQCRELLAGFMAGVPSAGVQNIALGRGEEAWDSTPPQAPSAGTDSLVDSAPVVIAVAAPSLTLSFIDDAGNPIAGPSTRLQITLSVTPGLLPISGDEYFPLREFALFGELNGAPRMVDYVRHPVMNIGAEDVLTRRIRLIF